MSEIRVCEWKLYYLNNLDNRKPKEDIQQRNNDNQDYDSDSEFKSFLIFKQNFNIKTIEKIDDKMVCII